MLRRLPRLTVPMMMMMMQVANQTSTTMMMMSAMRAAIGCNNDRLSSRIVRPEMYLLPKLLMNCISMHKDLVESTMPTMSTMLRSIANRLDIAHRYRHIDSDHQHKLALQMHFGKKTLNFQQNNIENINNIFFNLIAQANPRNVEFLHKHKPDPFISIKNKFKNENKQKHIYHSTISTWSIQSKFITKFNSISKAKKHSKIQFNIPTIRTFFTKWTELICRACIAQRSSEP